jgi:hypothetical protein
MALTRINAELKCGRRNEYRYLAPRNTVSEGALRISANPDAVLLYNHVR